jgi:hypothetical protein
LKNSFAFQLQLFIVSLSVVLHNMKISKIVLAIGVATIFAVLAGTFAIPNSAFAQQADSIIVGCADLTNTPDPNQDAPADGTALHYAVITNNQVIATEVIKDDAQGNQRGWDPNGMTYLFQIQSVSNLDLNSVVVAHTNDPANFSNCNVNWIGTFQPQQPQPPAPAPEGTLLKPSNMTTPSNATSQ